MFVDATAHDMHNNLLFELEVLGGSTALDAVSVYLWAESIPQTRHSEYRVERSYGGVYSLAVSMHEFEPFLHHHPGAGMRFLFGVQCGEQAVAFRSFVHFVHSDITPGHITHGEVCPNEWVYHVMQINTATLSATAGAHRRRMDSLVEGESAFEYVEHDSEAVEEDAVRRAAAFDAQASQGDMRRLSAAPTEDSPGIHVRYRLVKNIGDMNVLISLMDKPLRLIPPYTFLDTATDHSEHIICNVDRYLLANSSARPMRYYVAVKGGSVCAHYEIAMETFTTSCSAAMAAAYTPNSTIAVSHGSPGARECPQSSVDCILSMRHYMRASCDADERAPPFVLQLPYTAGHNPDNLVLEVEDLNAADSPNSLTVRVYQTTGTHEQLMATDPLLTTNLARKRIFSLGLSSIEMAQAICGGACTSNGQTNFSIVVACGPNPVRFRVIALLTPLELELGVPVHGEVCPNNWIFHRFAIHDTAATHDASGVRFLLHVHLGDVYYLISRWDRTPGFAACNANEFAMSGLANGQVDICGLSSRFTGGHGGHGAAADAGNSTGRRLSSAATMVDASQYLSDQVVYGFIGLYGGTSCAHYTLDAVLLAPYENCSNVTTSTCTQTGV